MAWAIDTKDVPVPEQGTSQYNVVALQGLNKVTGNISKLQGPVGTILRFGNLEIVAHRCWKSDPEDQPENAALLDISELKPGEPPKRIFLGWMFSSSPGLSGLENPVYDITVLSCIERGNDDNDDADDDKADKKEEKPEKKEPKDNTEKEKE